MKICCDCGQEKPLDQFRRTGLDRKYRLNYCNDCFVIRQTKRAVAKPPKEESTTRVCRVCGEEKPIERFPLVGIGKRYHSHRCHKCTNFYSNEPHKIKRAEERAAKPIPNSKHCTKCGEEKPLSEFWPRDVNQKRTLYQTWCKRCNMDTHNAWKSERNRMRREALGLAPRGVKPENSTCARCNLEKTY